MKQLLVLFLLVAYATANAIKQTAANAWVDGVVGYALDPLLGVNHTKAITDAMKLISDKTCVQFIRKSTATHRIMFKYDKTSSYCFPSDIGRKDAADNEITLGEVCGKQPQLVARQIMHTLAFYPMQARPEAATLLKQTAANFDPKFVDPYKALMITVKTAADLEAPLPPFDYGSLLMYGAIDFSTPTAKVEDLKPSYEAVDQTLTNAMGHDILTSGDIDMINNLFKCDALCPGAELNCNNGGRVNPNQCDQCLCQDGFAGENCNYLPVGAAPDVQGKILAATTTWKTEYVTYGRNPNIGIRNEMLERVDWIQAPQGRKIQVQVIQNIDPQCHPGCKTADIQFKNLSVRRTGVTICCPNQLNKTITSNTNPTPVIVGNRWSWSNFKYQYKYV